MTRKVYGSTPKGLLSVLINMQYRNISKLHIRFEHPDLEIESRHSKPGTELSPLEFETLRELQIGQNLDYLANCSAGSPGREKAKLIQGRLRTLGLVKRDDSASRPNTYTISDRAKNGTYIAYI